MGKGGGSAPAPSSQTVNQTNLPAWAQPYSERVLGQAEALTDTTQHPYEQYTGQRVADFTPVQQQSFQNIQGMQPNAATGAGIDVAANAARQASQYGAYQPQQFGNQFQGQDFNSMGLGYLSTQNPNLQNFQMQGPQNVRGAQTQAAQLNTAPMFAGTQFQGPQNVGAERVGTQDFTNPATAQSYMNPYMQNVVDVQQREAQRQADIAKLGRNAQAVGAGAFGGSRQAIQNAEAARNLAIQKGDIQAQGLNAAYNQAQQAFQTDQARQLQAQQANQQAGLQAGLANQQMGYNTGLQNAQLGQQAGLANQALAGQYGLQQGQFNQAANLANQQMRQQANLANQQMGYNVGNTNLQALLGVQQLGSGQNLQSQLANQQAYGQMQGLGMQQNLAGNQQAMQNAQLAAQYGLAGQQAGEQSRQFGANLGLQGLQQQLAAAGQLGQLGQQQYGQQMGINAAQQNAGAQQQAMNQQRLTDAYQDYLNRANYPYKQLGFMSDILHGTPVGQTQTIQNTAAPPSMWSNIAGLGQLGLGAAAIGKSGLFGKEGGAVKSYAEGGIASLPDISASKQVAVNATKDELARGQTPAAPDLVPELQAMLALYSKAKQQPSTPPEDTVMGDLLKKITQAPAPQPPMGMPPQPPQQPPMQNPGMAAGGLAGLPAANFNDDSFAGGGIIAFTEGGPNLVGEDLPVDLDDAQRKRIIEERVAARDAARAAANEMGKSTPAPQTVGEEDAGIKRAKEMADKRMPQTDRDLLRGRTTAPTPGVIEPDAALKAAASKTAPPPVSPAPAPAAGTPAGLAATPEGTAAAEARIAGNPAVAKEVAKLDARIAEGVKRGKDVSKLITQRASLVEGLGATASEAAAPVAGEAAKQAGKFGLKSLARGAVPVAGAALAGYEAGQLFNQTPLGETVQRKLGDAFDYFDSRSKQAGQTATAQVTPEAIATQKVTRAVTPQADQEGNYPRQAFANTVAVESKGRHMDDKGNLIRPLDKNGNPISTAQGITQLKSDLYPIGGKPVEVVGGIKVLPPQDNSKEEFLRAGYDIKNAYYKYYNGDLDKTDLAYFKGPTAVNAAIKAAEKAGKPEDWVKFLPESKKGDMSNEAYLAAIRRGRIVAQSPTEKVIEKAKKVVTPVADAIKEAATPEIIPAAAKEAGAKAVQPYAPNNPPPPAAKDAADAAFAKAAKAKAEGDKVDADKFFNIGMALMASGAGTLGGESQYAWRNIGKGAGQGLGIYSELSKQDKAEKLRRQQLAETTRKDYAQEARGILQLHQADMIARAKQMIPDFDTNTDKASAASQYQTAKFALDNLSPEHRVALYGNNADAMLTKAVKSAEAILGKTASGAGKVQKYNPATGKLE